jgi:polysaccharide export outer membrane protein
MNSRRWEFVFVYIYLSCLICIAGCNGAGQPTAEEMEIFEQSGLTALQTDSSGTTTPKIHSGVYRVVPGDVLEFYMPTILRTVFLNSPGSAGQIESYQCRVGDSGTISLPIIGELNVNGKTFTEIESAVVEAYFPKHLVDRPSVVCRVKEHRNQRVFTVLGLVRLPNTFPYPPDVQYNLMEAIAFAGGIDLVADPHYVKVYRQDVNGKIVSAAFRIDGKFLADTYNIEIRPGDVIYVDQTLRTRANTFLSKTLNIGIGADMRYYSR